MWGQNNREAKLYGMVYLGDGHEGLDVKKRWTKKRSMNIFTLVKATICNTGKMIPGHKIWSIFWGVVCRGDNFFSSAWRLLLGKANAEILGF